MHVEGRQDSRIDLQEWSLDMQKLRRWELGSDALCGHPFCAKCANGVHLRGQKHAAFSKEFREEAIRQAREERLGYARPSMR